MNFGMVRYMLSRLLLLESTLLIPSVIVGVIYDEDWKNISAFLVSIAILICVSFVLGIKKPGQSDMYVKEGFLVTSMGWILMSLFGSIPFLISGCIPSPVDAFFETASGFTTTGATILMDVETLPHSMLFWRSFTHLVGGMGVLVFMLAILPSSGSAGVHIMKAEVPGPVFGKLLSKVSNTARVLYIIYLMFTLILIIALLSAGMPGFDSIVHAFGAAGTGGFGIKSDSIAYYDSTAIDMILGFAMLLFGVNFNLYFLLLAGHFKSVLRSEELKWYVCITASAIALISFNVRGLYESFPKMLRDVFFAVSSIVTTTGYSTADFGAWPLFSHIVLLLLMACGAMAGSTAGGLKVSRVAIYVKTLISEIKRAENPHRVLPVKFEGKHMDSAILKSVTFYLLVYVSVFSSALLIISLDAPDFLSAFSAIAATLNNIGPGLGAVGPAGSYAGFSNISKLTMTLIMIAGRLELLPILMLFSIETWRKV